MTDDLVNERILADLVAKIQNVKLGPGVVGRNSTIAWSGEIVMLAGVVAAAYLHSVLFLGVSIGGGIVIPLLSVSLNTYFGNKNPPAALLEGAQFLEYRYMEMAAKGVPVIEPSGPPVPEPPKLPPENTRGGTQ